MALKFHNPLIIFSHFWDLEARLTFTKTKNAKLPIIAIRYCRNPTFQAYFEVNLSSDNERITY